MKDLDEKYYCTVNGGVEIPTPSLLDALIVIATELYNAIK